MDSYRTRRKRQRDDFLVQGSILAVTSILVRIIGLVYRIPMTRILGNEGIGYYGYAFEIYNFCFIISSYGMPMAVSKLVSEYNAKKEYKNSLRILFGSLSVSLVSGGLLSAGVYFGSSFISTYFFKNASVQIPLQALAPTVLVSALLGVIRGYFQGNGTMIPTAFSQFMEQVVNGIVSVAAAYELTKAHSASLDISAHGAAGGVTGTFVGAFFGLIVMFSILFLNIPYLTKIRRRDTHRPESMLRIIKIILITVIPVMLSQVLVRSNGLIAMALFNNVLYLKGVAKEVYASLYGIYEGKYLLLCNIVMGVTSAITTAIIPSLVREKVLSSEDEIGRKVRMALKFNMIIAIPSTVGLAVLGGPIIRLLFGDNDPLISRIMLVGSSAVMLYTMSILFSTVIQSVYSMIVPVVINLIAIAVNIPLLYLLLTYTELGIMALVIANLVMPAIVIVLSLIVIKVKLGTRLEIFRTYIVTSIASLLMGVLVFFIYNLINRVSERYYLGLAAALPIGVFSFFVFELLLKGVSRKELRNFPKGEVLIKLAKKLHLMK